jgi:hypothetical protein
MLSARFSDSLRGTRLFVSLLPACIAVGLTMPSRAVAVAERLSTPMVSIGGDDLRLERGGRIIDFAISPDNDKVAVAFVESQGGDKLRVWLGEWEVATKKLIAKTHLGKPISPGIASVGLIHRMMQYDPEGSEIILQAGNDLCAFESSNLALRYTVSNPSTDGDLTTGVFERLFALSTDGTSLAVLSGQSEYPNNKIGSVGIYDAKSGRELSRWSAPAHIATLSPSPDGNRVLVTVFDQPDSTDILLLDSKTGGIIKRYVSGFGQAHGRAASRALFVDADHFVVSPGGWIGAKGNYPGESLKVFDSRTGDVTAELRYDKFGPSDDIWVSSRDSTVAMLNVWMSGLKRRFNFNESGPKDGQLLFFHPMSGGPFCIVGPFPEKSDQHPRQSGFIRPSPDFGLVGLFVNSRVALYSMPECKEPRK